MLPPYILSTFINETFSNLTPWQRVALARHPGRPYTSDYVDWLMEDFVELHGDRAFSDDPALLCGLGKLGPHQVLLVGHRKGRDLKEKIACNFGCAHPEGYKKALRKMKVAEKFGIPIGETFAGKGAMLEDTPLALGGYGVTGAAPGGKLMHKADLVICIGTRLIDFATGSQSAFNHPKVKFISINVNGHDAYKQGALSIVADARETLKALLAESETTGVQVQSDLRYLQEVAEMKREWQTMLTNDVFVQHEGEAMSQLHAINVVNEQAKAGDTIIAAAGGPPGDLHQLWDTSGQRHCHLEFGYSCMGYEIPAGLGVRMFQPWGEVYVFIGDGTYLMQPTELVTAMQEGLKITVLVMNNRGFQIIRRLQMGRVGISFGNEFRKREKTLNRLEGDYVDIDFAKNAESMGARAWNVSTPDELRRALQEARQESGSCVIVAEIEPNRYGPSSEVWWDVAAAEVTNDSETKDARAEYESDRYNLQKFHY